MVVCGLLVLVIALWALPLNRDDESGIEQKGDNALRLGVTLQAGYESPLDALPAKGQTLQVPLGTESLVLAAPAGEQYAVRVGRPDDLGPWMELSHPDDEGPDGVVFAETPKTSDGSGTGRPEPDPDVEDYRSEQRALPPILLSGLDTTVEVVNTEGDGRGLQATFLMDEGPIDGGPPLVAGRRQAGPPGPAIMPRSAWTSLGWASENGGCGRGPSYADNIQAVVVHHTVTNNRYSQEQVDDLLRAFRYSHVEVNGWCDIGYNFLVDRFGTIWEGRTGGVDRAVIGGHAKGFNTSTMGVALIGQHQPRAQPAVAEPSASARQGVLDLIHWKLARHGIDPAGTTWLRNRSSRGPHRLTAGQLHLVPTIMGHRHLGLTSCPGDHGLDVVSHLTATLAPAPADRGVYRYPDRVPFSHGPGLVIVNARGELRSSGSATIEPSAANDSPVAPPSPQPKAVAATLNGGRAQGWTLHGDGMLHPFGGAPDLPDRPAGARPVVDLALAAGGGGWVVAVDGGIYGFGGQANLIGQAPTGAVIAADLTAAGDGYMLDESGGLLAVGNAPGAQPSPKLTGAVDIAVHPSGRGGWVVAADGVISPFGDAPAAPVSVNGQQPGPHPVVAIAASASGRGGWLATADGQLWPFGPERLIFPASTDAAAANTVDLVFAGSHLPDGFLKGNDSRYMTGLSQLFRHRSATPDELELWDGWLTYRGGRQDVALELARSPEWGGSLVEQMYSDVLGRASDADGLRYWLARLASGARVADVGAAFYGSPEYVQSAGSTQAYVELLYQRLLDRSGDQSGVANWVHVIDSGRATPTQVAGAFYGSSEYRRQRSDELFREVLNRSPESSALAFWANRLAQTDEVNVVAELAMSDEFYRSTLE